MTAQDETEALKKELAGLFHYIKRVRVEIAAIHHPVDEDHHFDKMSDQLDAIVEATESATDLATLNGFASGTVSVIVDNLGTTIDITV